MTIKHARDLKKCTTTIQDFVLLRLNEKIANKLLDSINVLHDNYVGTLTRCLFSLEVNGTDDDESDLSASKALQEVNYSSLSHQNLLISIQILHSAYRVNIALSDNSSLLQILVDRMKEVSVELIFSFGFLIFIQFQFFRTLSWNNLPRVDSDFKCSIAMNMLNGICEAKYVVQRASFDPLFLILQD